MNRSRMGRKDKPARIVFASKVHHNNWCELKGLYKANDFGGGMSDGEALKRLSGIYNACYWSLGSSYIVPRYYN